MALSLCSVHTHTHYHAHTLHLTLFGGTAWILATPVDSPFQQDAWALLLPRAVEAEEDTSPAWRDHSSQHPPTASSGLVLVTPDDSGPGFLTCHRSVAGAGEQLP